MVARRSLKKRSAARVAWEFFTPKIWMVAIPVVGLSRDTLREKWANLRTRCWSTTTSIIWIGQCEDLIAAYCIFGDDPFIVTGDPDCRFSAITRGSGRGSSNRDRLFVTMARFLFALFVRFAVRP